MGNPIRFVDPDGKAPENFDPTKHIIFVQAENRNSLPVTGSVAVGVYLKVDNGNNISAGWFTTNSVGGGIIGGSSFGITAGVVFLENSESFEGYGINAGFTADLGIKGFAGEVNLVPKDIKQMLNADSKSFYDTFINDSKFGFSGSAVGIGLQFGGYVDVSYTSIHPLFDTAEFKKYLKNLGLPYEQMEGFNKLIDNFSEIQNEYCNEDEDCN